MKSDSHYRPDIDGLRGVAVLFVLFYHGFAAALPGGFIGVDIFFVISGYLITSILLNDLAQSRFSIATFYARRIKRIFPALIVVLAFTVVLGWFVLFPDEFRYLGKHVVGGAVFISNLLLWRETGYFDPAAELKPLLHLWSLGIEEQFYIFFPLLLWLANRRGLATTHFLVVLFVLSFGLSLLGTSIRPVATFFLPITRFWELLVGCTLAAIEAKRNRLEKILANQPSPASASAAKTTGWWANAGSGLGFALILVGALRLDKADPFPGWWALLPTFGAALMISAGKASSINRWILGNKLIVGVGLISYPLYLWHWPLLYFGRILLPNGMSNMIVAGLLAAAALLAVLTYWLIERPIRFGGIFGEKTVLLLSASMTGLLALGLLALTGAVPSRWGLDPVNGDAWKAALDWDYPFLVNEPLTSGFKVDTEIVRGKPGRAILFIGDSHMQNYWPCIEQALNQLQTNSRPVIFVTKGGSPALPGVNKVQPGSACDQFFDFAMREADNTNVSTVVFSCFWEKYFIGGYPFGGPWDLYRVGDQKKSPIQIGSPAANQVFAEFGQDIGRLTKLGKEVVVILPGPSYTFWDPRLIRRMASATDTNQIRMKRTDFETFIRPVKQALIEAATANGGRTIDPLDYFAEDGYLNGKTPLGRFRYSGNSHLRPFYIREKASFIEPLLRASAGAQ